VLRLDGGQTGVWDELLPEELRKLPADLSVIDER
jgi:hypothetical protein